MLDLCRSRAAHCSPTCWGPQGNRSPTHKKRGPPRGGPGPLSSPGGTICMGRGFPERKLECCVEQLCGAAVKAGAPWSGGPRLPQACVRVLRVGAAGCPCSVSAGLAWSWAWGAGPSSQWPSRLLVARVGAGARVPDPWGLSPPGLQESAGGLSLSPPAQDSQATSTPGAGTGTHRGGPSGGGAEPRAPRACVVESCVLTSRTSSELTRAPCSGACLRVTPEGT